MNDLIMREIENRINESVEPLLEEIAGIDLSLASRIEAALEPWLLPWGEGEVKEAKGVGV